MLNVKPGLPFLEVIEQAFPTNNVDLITLQVAVLWA